MAGIAAGSAPGYAGAAPNADIVMLDVMDDSGKGMTSDVIAAAGWIYENKSEYNIRVDNFSLHSGSIGPFYNDPLDRAVEKLCGGVVVVAAGNYGSATGPSGVRRPGNDPFRSPSARTSPARRGSATMPGTVVELRTDVRRLLKPEICAAGRYMVGLIPLARRSPLRPTLVGGGYVSCRARRSRRPCLGARLSSSPAPLTPDQVGDADGSCPCRPEGGPRAVSAR